MYITVYDELLVESLGALRRELEALERGETAGEGGKPGERPGLFGLEPGPLNEALTALVERVAAAALPADLPEALRDVFVKYYFVYCFLVYGHVLGSRSELQYRLLAVAKLNFELQLPTRRFFTSEFTHQVFESFDVLQQTKYILSLEDVARNAELEAHYTRYRRTVDFLNEVGLEVISSAFVGREAHHNIILFIIVKLLYERQDKADVIVHNNRAQVEQLEFRYIYVTSSSSAEVGVQDLAEILESEEQAVDFYEMLFREERPRHLFSADARLNTLFRKKLLYPITEDFMRYHVLQDARADQETTRVAAAVQPLNDVRFADPDEPLPDELFFPPLLHRRAVPYNEYEELQLVQKYLRMDRSKFVDPLFHDLFAYRQYAYHGFQRPRLPGFTLLAQQTTTALRHSNFEFAARHGAAPPDCRTVAGAAHVVGVAVLPRPTYVHSAQVQHFLSAAELDRNPFIGLMRYVASSFKHPHSTPIYYLYSPLHSLKVSPAARNANHFKSLLNELFALIERLTYQYTYSLLMDDAPPYLNLAVLEYCAEQLVLEDPVLYNQLLYAIHYRLLPMVEPRTDEMEVTSFGFNAQKVPLPTYDPAARARSRVVSLVEQAALEEVPLRAICYHHSVLAQVFRHRNQIRFAELLNQFVDDYADLASAAACRSCGELLPLQRYVTSEFEDLVVRTAIEIPLFEVREYAKYAKTIKNMDALFEKLGMVLGYATFVGPGSMQKRHNAIKQIIDLANDQYARLKKETAAERQRLLRGFHERFGTAAEFTQLYLFAVDNELFSFSRKDIDKFKLLKYNNLICHFIVHVLTNLNRNQLLYLAFDRLFNLRIFLLKFQPLFEGMRVYTSATALRPIQEFPVLCYLLFYLAAMVAKARKYHAFHAFAGKVDVLLLKQIIHTSVTLLNSLIYREAAGGAAGGAAGAQGQERPDAIEVKNFKVRYFQQLRTLFADRGILDAILQLLEGQMAVQGDRVVYKVPDLQLFALDGSGPGDYDLQTDLHSPLRLPQKLSYPRLPHLQTSAAVPPPDSCLNICRGRGPTPFHHHHAMGADFRCRHCGLALDALAGEPREACLEHFLFKEIELKRQIHCADGRLHSFLNGVCMKCAFVRGDDSPPPDPAAFLAAVVARKPVHPPPGPPPAPPALDFVSRPFRDSVLFGRLQALAGAMLEYFDEGFEFSDQAGGQDFFIQRTAVDLDFTHELSVLKEPAALSFDQLQFLEKEHRGGLQTFVAAEHQGATMLFHPLTLFYVGHFSRYDPAVVARPSNHFLRIRPSFLLRLVLGGYDRLFVPRAGLRAAALRRYGYLLGLVQSVAVAVARIRAGDPTQPFHDVLHPAFARLGVSMQSFAAFVRARRFEHEEPADLEVYGIDGEEHVLVLDLINVKSADNLVLFYLAEELGRVLAALAGESRYVCSNFVLFVIYHVNRHYVFNNRQLNDPPEAVGSLVMVDSVDAGEVDAEEEDEDEAADAREREDALDVSRDPEPDEEDPEEDYRDDELTERLLE